MDNKNESPQWQTFIIDSVLKIMKIGNRFFLLMLILLGISSLFRLWFSGNQFDDLWNVLGFNLKKLLDVSITLCILIIFALVIINLTSILPYEKILRIFKRTIIKRFPEVTHQGYLSYAYPITDINISNLKELSFDLQKLEGTYWRSSITIRGNGYEKLSFQIYEGDSEPTRSVVNNLGFLQVLAFYENKADRIQLPEMFLKPDVPHTIRLTYENKLLEIYIDSMKLFSTNILLTKEDFITLNTWADEEPRWNYKIEFKNIKVTI